MIDPIIFIKHGSSSRVSSAARNGGETLQSLKHLSSHLPLGAIIGVYNVIPTHVTMAMFLQRVCRRIPGASCRAFHTTEECEKEDIGVYRQARMIKKLMTGSNRPKRKFFNVDQTPAKQFTELQFLESKGSSYKRTYSNRSKQRVKVLNVLFVEQITSLLSTGEVEKELRKTGGILRHQLSQLRVIGIVPPIIFLKDPIEDRMNQVELALSKCDFGEDHVPVDLGTSVKAMQPFPMYSSAGKKLDLNLESMENHDEEVLSDDDSETRDGRKKRNEKLREEEILNQSLDNILEGPPMRQDILGLDRDAIMEKILKTSQRSKKPPKEYIPILSVPPEGTDAMEKDRTMLQSSSDRRKEFLKFLNQMRVEKKREAQRSSSATSEKEFQDLLNRERLEKEYAAIYEHEEEEFEDYVDEVYDSKKSP
ncbi:unnamed protein product [Allacma fusca]|uniref:Uncharacterized protein n=1 Tax=Allacma fusca TaxID=39272 RepID=A0A8J2KQS6_9HEXA|nr:unnamed protein product [Allacma fusca]